MIYSCFHQPSGYYRYFWDEHEVPVNGDLPVPNWLTSKATKLGTPANEAGRPLPKSARPMGHGLQARGMVCHCEMTGLSGLGELSSSQTKALIAVAALGTAGLLWYSGQKLSSGAIGAVALYSLLA